MERKSLSRMLYVTALSFAQLIPVQSAALGSEVDFLRDVQPILAGHCSHCHGVDQATRQGNLRLDVRESVLAGGDSGLPSIVPGRPDESELIRRINAHDADTIMPPPSEQKPLSEPQIDVLRRWIANGAVYEQHWAFVGPQKAALPLDNTANPDNKANPVDAFVLARLHELGIEPAPEADSATLCRRLYLDLIGLPPSPGEIAAFEQQGFQKTVELLLASERFGEKWARPWMDAARYSDTNGYEKDLRREQWAWRDWVINAFNTDLPYDRFLVEQIAGDLLPEPTQDQIIATGFLRNSMLNEEGAIVAEQFRMVEMFDRMDCIGKAVLGLSTQCAQCHSHKFDPLTHDEYYGMFAFLNNSYEARSWVFTAEQQQQLHDLDARISAIEQTLKTQHPDWEQQLQNWEAEVLKQQPIWEPIEALDLGSISGLNHPTQESDRSILMLGHTSADIYMLAAPELSGVTGLRLEALTHGELPHRGPGRSQTGTWGVSELEVFVQPPGTSDWQKLKLVKATADFSLPETKSADGKKSSGPVSFLIDGSDETTWSADRGPGRRNQPSVAVLQFEQPLDFPAGSRLKLAMRMTDMLGCCRLSLTRQSDPVAANVDHAAILAMQTAASDRSLEQQQSIFNAWRSGVTEFKELNNQIQEVWKSFPQAQTSILHCSERPEHFRRTTHLLDRGEWDQPLHVVHPHTPAALHSFPQDQPTNRLGFAYWLTDRQSPLTARVAVNRVWQVLFGEGLVETPEDFGTRAAVPEYRQLLDWLAVDFMEHGWSHKHLIRTIVSSATYQRSSQISEQHAERDPNNRLLARGPRFRADAEVVRDIALSVSGLISLKTGGPSVIPPVPQNVLDYNYVYPDYWKPAEGADRYRRAIYVFRKRSMPDPVMTSFDGPNGDFACARRLRSNTPMAALAGLNETVFVESARALALRILREGGTEDLTRIDYGFRVCTGRYPNEEERRAVQSLLISRRQKLADGWLNPREISTGDAARLPELPPSTTPQDAAAWTLVARVLLNLDETISKN